MSRGSVSIDVRDEVSIDVRDEVSIDVGWKISVDGRVASVDDGDRVSVDEIGVCVDGGWRVSKLVWLSIDDEHLSLRIKRSNLVGSDENSSGVSLLLLVLLGMHLK
ncbi:hypothetical protein F2Q70_00011992 [Brassica cretica]|uniref:Uncharacterized protein n=2 Tax=Brassica cretica TaxID=69181 RepID=A0A8S9J831_BRACR|nr:hypothetical protein F2Q68_00005067 [Brassica cretica]KAF2611606.1 hypothetical protein F2Q70_00011992 [Brassica cretica]KAF3547273.1 hypothetical protein DY000_02007679 [Brassica cretica]